jgi:CheY-like chemotaxis protein
VPSANGRGARRLLVVDDNRDSADTLAELARIWGFEVDTAYDGLAALQRAREWEPAFVFLDSGMPGLNGYEVARRLREEGRFQNTTLVALTGYGQAGDIERSWAAGFNHHLVKPVDVDELEKLLRSASRPIRMNP